MSEININEKVARAIAAATSPEEVRRILHEAAIAQGLAREVQVMPDGGSQMLTGAVVLAPLPARPRNQVNDGNFDSSVDAMIARRMREVTGQGY